MMKNSIVNINNILFIILLFNFQQALSQSYIHLGSSGSEIVLSSDIDNDGNVYFVCSTNSVLQVNGTTINNENFLLKTDTVGNILEMKKGNYLNVYINKRNEICLTGGINDTIVLETDTIFPPASNQGGFFVSVYDNQFNYMYSDCFYYSGNIGYCSTSSDTSGNLLLGFNYFLGSFNHNGNVVFYNNSNSADAFILKIDSARNIIAKKYFQAGDGTALQAYSSIDRMQFDNSETDELYCSLDYHKWDGNDNEEHNYFISEIFKINSDFTSCTLISVIDSTDEYYQFYDFVSLDNSLYFIGVSGSVSYNGYQISNQQNSSTVIKTDSLGNMMEHLTFTSDNQSMVMPFIGYTLNTELSFIINYIGSLFINGGLIYDSSSLDISNKYRYFEIDSSLLNISDEHYMFGANYSGYIQKSAKIGNTLIFACDFFQEFYLNGQVINSYGYNDAIITYSDLNSLHIKQEEIDENTIVYPNPSRNKINIKQTGLSTDAIKISLFDQLGRSVKNQTSFEEVTSLDISDLPAGLYFLELRGNRTVKGFKIIIQ